MEYLVLWRVFLWHIMWVNQCHKPPPMTANNYI